MGYEKNAVVQKRYPEEFKRDIVAVTRWGDLTAQNEATDFGVAEEAVCRWMRQADDDEGIRVGTTSTGSWSWCGCGGGSAAWRWRTRSCAEQRRTSVPQRSHYDLLAGP